MDNKLMAGRLVLAIISTTFEEIAIYAIWRWLLPEFGIYLPVAALAALMASWLAFSLWLFVFTTKTIKKQVPIGLPSMVGATGKAAGPLDPEGMVRIRGELWGAVAAEGNIGAGEAIVVVSQDGLKLKVHKARTGRPTR